MSMGIDSGRQISMNECYRLVGFHETVCHYGDNHTVHPSSMAAGELKVPLDLKKISGHIWIMEALTRLTQAPFI